MWWSFTHRSHAPCKHIQTNGTTQISLRVDVPTGRFILKNISRYTFVTIKRTALGWGGTPSEVDLNKGEVRYLLLILCACMDMWLHHPSMCPRLIDPRIEI
jgi:hypothetical protein